MGGGSGRQRARGLSDPKLNTCCVQRAVLARELGGHEARILVAANPCFGLDFAATSFVHNQLMDLRNRGGSVLLVSEDLDAQRVRSSCKTGDIQESNRL